MVEGLAGKERVSRILQGMRLEQQRYRFATARALASTLCLFGDSPELFPIQRSGLLLAQQLALVESQLEEASRWGDELAGLQRRQGDAELARAAGSEPLRGLRLEIGACPEAAETALQILQNPRDTAIGELCDALERQPQALSLAFALLLTLRRRGLFEFEPASPGANPPPASPIPAHLWLLRRYNATSAELEQRETRWRQLHPDWQLTWLDHQIEAIEAMDDLPELVREACLCTLDPAIRGDLLRLAHLWRHGGVAVDWCINPLQDLQPLLEATELLLVQDAFGSVGSELWAAPPGHPWVEEALLQACRHALQGQGYSRWIISGPCLLSGITARYLQPTLLSSQTRPIGFRLITSVELQRWLGLGAAEPKPKDYSEPALKAPLNRRRGNWLMQRWQGMLPPLEIRSSWQQLTRQAQDLGYTNSGRTPTALVTWLLQQPNPPLQDQLANLLDHPPNWVELFPLLQNKAAATTEPPALDPIQQAEAKRQQELNNLYFGWLPLGGSFKNLIETINNQGRKPWIIDAGTHSGHSACWLAKRWPNADVICVVPREADQELVTHNTSGTAVRRLHSPLVGGAQLTLEQGTDNTLLNLPVERLHPWIKAQNGEPLLLHLDMGMEGCADWFQQRSDWLQHFPFVLLHGALDVDDQGRRLPKVHQQAIAAAGFELVRSGDVIVAFQRHRLTESSTIKGADTAGLPPLDGTILEKGGVVAFVGEWQYPAITEKLACRLAMLRLPYARDTVYVGFPWASLIDHLNNGTMRGRALKHQLHELVDRLDGRSRRITVCQQIFFEDHRWAFELAGITDVFWSHTTIHSSLPGITLHPFPLFPVQWQAQSGAAQNRDILYSFIGAQATRRYLSNSRDLILSNLANLPGSLIRGNSHWFYDDLVYKVQIRETLNAQDPLVIGEERRQQERTYLQSLQRSVFALCPSGTGPNTIRLWEALGCGAIPVVLSDTWKPPGPRELWDNAVFFLPDTPEGVLSIPRLTAQWAANEGLLHSKRLAMAELWQRYGPATFITDIETLWQQQSGDTLQNADKNG